MSLVGEWGKGWEAICHRLVEGERGETSVTGRWRGGRGGVENREAN